MDKGRGVKDAEAVVHQFLDFIEEQYGISREDLDGLISKRNEEPTIPIEILNNRKLGCMEAVVKFLKENNGLSYNKISELIGRSRSTVGVMYHNASRKLREPLPNFPSSPYPIPLSQFADERYSALESVVLFLIGKGLRVYQIAEMLSRDYRTIYTVYQRGKRKNER